MKICYKDIPSNKTIDDYPDDTEFVLDDRPVKYDPKTLKRVYPDQPGYKEAKSKEELLLK